MTLPTRLTIVPEDSVCTIEGVSFDGVDMTSLASDIHAVQWYGAQGELEIKDPLTGKMQRNEIITNLDSFQAVIDSYWEIRSAAEVAEQTATQNLVNEQTILEV